MKKILVLFIFIMVFVCPAAFSQDSIKPLTLKQMKEDLMALKKGLIKLHPGLYRYITPLGFERIFADAEKKLESISREPEFYVLLAQTTSRIRCYHTYLNPDNQTDDIQERLYNQKTLLPFYFRFVGKKMIVTGNVSPISLPLASEIIKINGVAVNKIVKKLETIVPADGKGTAANRLNALEVNPFRGSHYAAFDIFFPLLFKTPNRTFTIEARPYGERKAVKLQVAAMTRQERIAATERRYGKVPDYDDAWSFEIQTNNIAYLKIANSETWELKKIKWQEFLAEAFRKIGQQAIKSLIIDLRGNDGGDTSLGYELARYLVIKESPVYIDTKRLVRNIAPQPELLPMITVYNRKLRAILDNGFSSANYRKTSGGYYEILPNKDFEDFPPVAPAENNFAGKTFIVGDSSNASATFRFLDYVQRNKLATIVGQPSGGNKQGINGSSFLFLHLPNSQIEIDIPVFFAASREPEKDEGVAPDILIKPKIDDIAKDLDTELIYLSNRIKSFYQPVH